MMEAVPMALQPAWRQAFAFVLDRIKGADSEAAHSRALKWLLCLPAMLLRRERWSMVFLGSKHVCG